MIRHQKHLTLQKSPSVVAVESEVVQNREAEHYSNFQYPWPAPSVYVALERAGLAWLALRTDCGNQSDEI